jgi:hypothetical protein
LKISYHASQVASSMSFGVKGVFLIWEKNTLIFYGCLKVRR